MIERIIHWCTEWQAARKRRALIRSAQRKVAARLLIERDDSGRIVSASMSKARLTSDEWNALAYEPLQEAMRSIREHHKRVIEPQLSKK